MWKLFCRRQAWKMWPIRTYSLNQVILALTIFSNKGLDSNSSWFFDNGIRFPWINRCWNQQRGICLLTNKASHKKYKIWWNHFVERKHFLKIIETVTARSQTSITSDCVKYVRKRVKSGPYIPTYGWHVGRFELWSVHHSQTIHVFNTN